MKLQKTKQTRVIGSVALLALLFALSGCGGGGGSGDDEIAAKGPPPNSNSPQNDGGASIGVSNSCWIEPAVVVVNEDDGTTSTRDTYELFVETTITDKSSGEDPDPPDFVKVEIQPEQKVKKTPTRWAIRDISEDVIDDDGSLKNGDADPVTREYPSFETQIDLCAAGLTSDATSVNANLRVELFNSNSTYNTSKCSARDEGGLKLSNIGVTCPNWP